MTGLTRSFWPGRLPRHLLVLAVMAVQSGCALWPQLKPEYTLAREKNDQIKEHDKTILCLGNEAKAMQCAEQTIDEFSTLLNNAGYFERGSAYALLGIGSATAGAAAFSGTTDLFKGLALGAGSILGLNQVAGIDGQQQVLAQGLESVRCVYAVAKGAIAESRRARRKHPCAAVDPEILSLRVLQEKMRTFRDMLESTPSDKMLPYVAIARVQQDYTTLVELDRRLRALADTTPPVLGAAVIQIRQTVRRGLHDAVPALGDIVKQQRQAVEQMIGDFTKVEKPDPQMLAAFGLGERAAANASAKERLEKIVALACEGS